MVDSFSSHCVACYEPGNKAVGYLKTAEAIPKVRLFWKSETFRLVQSILFSPPFQPQVGVFFVACDISTGVETKLKSCSDNI